MRATVPQFIDVEDRVIGPLTIKQFLYLLAGGIVVFFFWFVFDLELFVIASIPVVLISLALAFFQVGGRPLIATVTSLFGYIFKPKVLVWRRDGQPQVDRSVKPVGGNQKTSGQTNQARIKKGQLDKLSTALDIF